MWHLICSSSSFSLVYKFVLLLAGPFGGCDVHDNHQFSFGLENGSVFRSNGPIGGSNGGASAGRNCDFKVRFNGDPNGAICIPDEFLLVRWFSFWEWLCQGYQGWQSSFRRSSILRLTGSRVAKLRLEWRSNKREEMPGANIIVDYTRYVRAH